MSWATVGGVSCSRFEIDRATVVFGSRVGGESPDPYSSLNVGLGTGDDPSRVARNRARLCAAAGVDPASVVMAKQVHGAQILEHTGAGEAGFWLDAVVPDTEADGHVTDEPGIVLAIITADCAPVALVGPTSVALVHCGWRGMANGLLSSAAMRTDAHTAVIGPTIGVCCYEIGSEVAQRFDAWPEAVTDGRLDLVSVARSQLEAAGVSQIELASPCTSCEEESFFSHRRDGAQTGRQGTLAWLN